MKELHQLTDLQLEIMDVVWERGRTTVAEVHEALLPRTGLARKTIGTLMGRLEKQGILAYDTDGREYVYRAAVSRGEVGRAKVGNLLSRLFQGNVSALLSHALEREEVRPGDVERVREMIDRWERGEEP